MATIDNLDIQISAQVGKANASLTNLVKKLDKVSASLSGVNARGLATLGAGVNKLSNAMGNFTKNTKTSDFTRLSKNLEAISKIDSGNFREIASNASSLSKSLKEMSSIDVSGIANIGRSMKKFERDGEKINASVGNLKKIGSSLKDATAGISSIPQIDNSINKFVSSVEKLSSVGGESEGSAKGLEKIGDSLTKITSDISKIKNIDSSINQFISSITKLSSAGEKSAIVARELPNVGNALKDAVSQMESAGNISDSVNSFTQAIAQLANVGERAEKTASGLDSLSQKTMNFFNTMKNAPEISQSTVQMTQAMAQLSAAGGKISSIGSRVSDSVKPASSAFYKLADVAEKTSVAIKKSMKGLLSIISGTFSKIKQIGIKSANSMKRVAGNMVAAFSRIVHSSKGLKTADSNLKNLLKTIIGFKGIQGLFNFGKNAIEFGSDISEVENVVNVAFGRMAQHAYDFASSAKEQFGLSELAAKQYSGTMMAMLKSSGVAQAPAAKMSTTLAGLAGDIASFYNIETDEAFYKLRSAISGETEPMKQLGVNMNIVNLEAFAMSRGINKAYREMTLAEQATLRYEYILARTGDAQGDFARTSGSWANQVRLLKLNFESLSGVIGQGLIAGILPAIKWLNALMSKLMEAAKAFRSFMYTLFGKVEGSQGGIVGDLDGVGSGLDDIVDSAEDAGKALKEKLLLLPFDELNVLTDTSDDLKDSLGEIDTDFDIGDFDLGEFEDVDTTPINKWAQAIRDAFLAQDWEGLGKTLAELVNAGLQKVYDAIIDITPKVEQALKYFAKVFNSFVEWLDWDLLGRTIGAGINLLTTSFNALFGDDGINLEMLGNKLSQGFRGMVDEIDWEDLGNALGNGFMIAWRVAYGFIWDMWSINPDTLLTGWEELGNGIAEAVNGIFDRIDFVKIAYTITHGVQGLIETLAAAIGGIDFEKIARKFNEGLREFYDGLKWENGMGASITKLTTSIVNAFNDLLDIDFPTIGKIVGAGITDIIRAFNQLTDALGGIDFEKLGTNISNGLRGLIEEIPWNEFGNALGNGFMVAWRILDGFLEGMAQENSAGLTGWQELGIAIGNAINGIFEKIDFETIANVLVMAFNGIIDSLKEATKTIDWEAISENLTNGLTTFVDGIDWVGAGETLSNLIIELLGVFQRVANDFDWERFGRSVGEFLSAIDWETIIGQVFDILWNVFGGFISGLFDTNSGKVVVAIGAGMALLEGIFKGVKLIKTVTDMVSTVSKIFGGLSISLGPTGIVIAAIVAAAAIIIANWDTIKEGAKLLKETVSEKFSEIKEKITDTWNGAKEKAHEVWDNVTGYLSDTWESIKEKATTKFGEARDKAVNAWDGAKEKAQNAWNSIPEYLENKWESIKEKAKEFGETAKEKVVNVWNGVKGIYLAEWEAIKGAVSGVWESMKESALSIFGGIVDSVKGIFNGITEFLDGVFSGDWKKAWDGIVQVFKNSFNVLPTVIEGVLNFITGSINGIFDGVNGIADKIPGLREKVPNIPKIPNVTLPRFSTGGFPEDGLFMANHTELVGKFANGRTAVANNEQITQGIRQAAYEGMIQALSEMSPYLADIAENTRRTAEKDMSVRIGDRDIVDSYMRGRSRMGHVFTD